MPSNITKILTTLEYEKVDVLGYSLGDGVALRTSIQYPELLNREALVSCTISTEGFFPEILAQQSIVYAQSAEMMK